MLNVYLMIAIAAVANVATVYFMKLSAGPDGAVAHLCDVDR